MNRRTQRGRLTASSSQRNRRIALLASAAGFLLAGYDHFASATAYYFDPAAKKDGTGGGTGTFTWNGALANWGNGNVDSVWPNANPNADEADFKGTASTVNVPGSINVNKIVFGTTGYTLQGAGPIVFSGTAPEIDVNAASGATDTISAPLQGIGTSTAPLTVNMSAANTLSITGANSFSGTTFAVGNGKLSIGSTANQITGTGALAKTGTGSLTLTVGNNNTGNWTISAGVIEVQSGTSLGTTAAGVTISGDGSTAKANSGELAISNMTDGHAITLSGGILGGDNGNSTYSNSVTVTANSNIRLGDFWENVNRNLTINGALSGAGSISFVNGGTAAASGQFLILGGGNSGYTGTMNVDAGHNVQFNTASSTFSGGVLTVSSSAAALAGVFMGNATMSAPTIIDNTNGNGGILGLGNGVNYSTALDFSNLGGNYPTNFFLGAGSGGGTYSASTLGPGAGNTYRLGGGGGALTIATPVLVDTGSPASVTIGSTQSNGGGTVILIANQTYTGATSINSGTLQVGNGGTSGSFVGDATIGGSGAALVFNRSAALSYNGNITNNASGQLIQNGTGAVTLGGAINNNGTLLVNGASSLIINGNASGSGTINQAAPGGQVTIGGADTQSGAIFINGGTLNISSTGSISGSPVQLNSGNVVVNGATGDSSLSSTTLAGGASRISGGFNASSNNLNLGGITRNLGTVLDIALTNGNATTTTGNTATTILGGYATVNGSTWAVNNGTNISGLTTFDNNLDANADVDLLADNSTGGAVGINSLRFNSPNSVTLGLGGNLTVASGGILETSQVGNNPVTINSNAILSNNANKDVIVIQNNTANAMTINSAIGAAGQAFTKAGAGKVVVTATDPFDQGLFLDAGTLEYTQDAQLGASGKTVSFNGGALRYAFQSTTVQGYANSRPWFFGLSGGTLEIVQPGKSQGGFISVSTSNIFTGPGSITKIGPGWMTINNAQSNTGSWTIAGGVVELNSVTGLGNNSFVNVVGDGSSNATNAGEIAPAGSTSSPNAGRILGYNINLAGGILSGDNGGTFNQGISTANGYTGNINVTANSSIRLGDFFGSTPRSMNITGNISGSANLRIIGPLGTTPAQGQYLALSGNNSGYTGVLTMGLGGSGANNSNYMVKFLGSTPAAAANSVIKNINFNAGPNNATNGLPVVLFDSTSTGGAYDLVAPPTITDQTGNGGIFAYNGGSYMGSLQFDLTPLADGKVFLGTTGGGTFWGFFKPGSDHTVRLTGFTNQANALNIGQPNAITDVGGVPTNLIVGAVGSNAFGFVKLLASHNYTGSTLIQSGTLMLGSNASPATTGSLPATTVVTFGTTSTNAAFDLNGNNETVAGLQVATGAAPNNQFVQNNSSTADAVLTVDTTAASSTFAGIIRDGTGTPVHKTGLTVQGSGGNALVLTNANAYTGPTTINGNTLQLGAGTTTGSIVQASVTDNGSLTFNHSDNIGFSGAITGTGNIVQNGAGSLQLNGANNIAGALAVNAGTVQIDSTTQNVGAMTGTGSGNLIVNSTLVEASHGANPISVGKLASLAINGSGKLDIADNDLAIAYGQNPSPIATIRGYLQSGRDNGAWDGNGLTSSKAQAHAGAIPHTALGYAETSALGIGPLGGTFDGAQVDNTTVVVKYVLSGDANLDGVVNLLDFNALASNFGESDSNAVWTSGDFTYDGNVSTNDFIELADSFNATLPNSAPVLGTTSLGALVPEPASLGMLALAGVAMLSRRRRNR